MNSPWFNTIVAAVFGLAAGQIGLRVWRGEPIRRRNGTKNDDKLAKVTVTMLPVSVFFIAASVSSLCLQIERAVANHGVKILFLVLATFMAAVSLVAIAFAFSLFFTRRPTFLVAPHLRGPTKG